MGHLSEYYTGYSLSSYVVVMGCCRTRELRLVARALAHAHLESSRAFSSRIRPGTRKHAQQVNHGYMRMSANMGGSSARAHDAPTRRGARLIRQSSRLTVFAGDLLRSASPSSFGRFHIPPPRILEPRRQQHQEPREKYYDNNNERISFTCSYLSRVVLFSSFFQPLLLFSEYSEFLFSLFLQPPRGCSSSGRARAARKFGNRDRPISSSSSSPSAS